MKNLLLILTFGLFLASCGSETKADNIIADTHSTFVIEGMTCAEMCAKRIEDKIARTEGVQTCTVDFEKKIASLNYDSKLTELETIVSLVEEMSDKKYSVSDVKTEKTSSSQSTITSSKENETGQLLSAPSFEIPNLLEYLRNII